MIETIVIVQLLVLGVTLWLVWDTRRALKPEKAEKIGLEPPKTRKIMAYTPGKNRIIARTEAEEAEIEERLRESEP